jgi:hypothetical protein
VLFSFKVNQSYVVGKLGFRMGIFTFARTYIILLESVIMRSMTFVAICLIFAACDSRSRNSAPHTFDLTKELTKSWPDNRTINLVFHGHSVPAGYFKTPNIQTLHSYPFILLDKIKKSFPYAQLNIIVTAKGGEHSTDGLKRFSGVLAHNPDVVFIDYSLNDRAIGLEKSASNLKEMIELTKSHGAIPVLLTSSPDLAEVSTTTQPGLRDFSLMIRTLGMENDCIVIDVYEEFMKKKELGMDISQYMAQSNHPNEVGHELIADVVFSRLFSK